MTGEHQEDPHATYLQYVGIAGATKECVEAVERLLLTGVTLQKAVILTVREGAVHHHALLVTTEHGDPIVVKGGFTSGYGGAGPKGFASVLELLDWHGVVLQEVAISEAEMNRLNASALTRSDVEEIGNKAPILPQRLWDYFGGEYDAQETRNPWRHRGLQIPMAIIDDRLAACEPKKSSSAAASRRK